MPRDSFTRTSDVLNDSRVNFDELLLPETILQGIKDSGYATPSPIQLRAIPVARSGVDVVAQAKSGTGKTCVFAVVALESVDAAVRKPQVLILAPTREVAWQSRDVIREIGCYLKGVRIHAFIGGMPLESDADHLQHCQVAVGTPGRVRALIDSGVLLTSHIRLVVFDEADSLFSVGFLEDIKSILKSLPSSRQTLCFSATFPPAILTELEAVMHNPRRIQLCQDSVALVGVRQYYVPIAEARFAYETFDTKVAELVGLLSRIPFHQCLVFTQQQARGPDLADQLSLHGWAALFISGKQDQEMRLSTIAAMRDFQIRVLISTDLTARGLDIDRVNLVVSLDLPPDAETYMHRVGRAGRFGGRGISVAIVTPAEQEVLAAFAAQERVHVDRLGDAVHPDEVAGALTADELAVLAEHEAIRASVLGGAGAADDGYESDTDTESAVSCSTCTGSVCSDPGCDRCRELWDDPT